MAIAEVAEYAHLSGVDIEALAAELEAIRVDIVPTYSMRTSGLGCWSLLTPLATTEISRSESWRRWQARFVVGATADGLRTSGSTATDSRQREGLAVRGVASCR